MLATMVAGFTFSSFLTLWADLDHLVVDVDLFANLWLELTDDAFFSGRDRADVPLLLRTSRGDGGHCRRVREVSIIEFTVIFQVISFIYICREVYV